MKPFSLTVLLTAGLTFSACTTTDPYTGEEKLDKKTAGAAVGAIGGAAAGSAAKGNKGRNMAIGAAVGSLIGLGVGAYMDKQEEAMRKELRGTGVSVTRKGDRIILNMPGNITFATGKSDIKSSFYKVLGGVARVLEKFDDTSIEIAGHTDSVGSAKSNQVLSERRADSVAGYLKSRSISSRRLQTVGFGESRPVASNGTATGRSKNRRVELELRKITH